MSQRVNTGAYGQFLLVLVRQLADKVCSIIRAALSDRLGRHWVRTQGAGTIHSSAGDVRCDDLLRCLLMLDPTYECSEGIKGVRTGPAEAVVHSWNHEQPCEIFDLCDSVDEILCFICGRTRAHRAHRGDHTFVVVYRVHRGDSGIRPPVIED